MQVVIYSKDDCPACQLTKLYLQHQKIPYIEKNIDRHTSFYNDIAKYGTVPQVFIDDENVSAADLFEKFGAADMSKLLTMLMDNG